MNNSFNGMMPSNNLDNDDEGYVIGNDITTTTANPESGAMDQQQYEDVSLSSFPMMLDEASLDHAILESLFYNEMAFLSSSTNNSNSITGMGDGSSPTATDTDSLLQLPPPPPLQPQVYTTSSMGGGTTTVNNVGITHNIYHPMFHTNTEGRLDQCHPPTPAATATTPTDSYNYAVPHTYPNQPDLVPAPVGATAVIDPLSGIPQNSSYLYAHGVESSLGTTTTAPTTVYPINHTHEPTQVRAPSTAKPFPRKPTVQVPRQTLAVATGGGIRHNVVPVLDKNDSERTEYPPTTSSFATTTTAATSIQKSSSKAKLLENSSNIKPDSIPHQKTTTSTAGNSSSDDKKRKKLISQFATLAGRLGITLPPQVLQKLTDKAVDKDTTSITNSFLVSSAPSASHNSIIMSEPTTSIDVVQSLDPPHQQQSQLPLTVKSMDEMNVKNSGVSQQPTHVSSSLSAVEDQLEKATVQPIILQHVRKSAEEAIAAVNNKRSNSSAALSSIGDSTANNSIGPNSESGGNKPYSKKRKKPRLSDCEQKLAELQSENMILKQHLANIANKNARLDDDRMKAETQMRQLLQENAPDDVLDPIVKNFTEMYSDYGRKRHDELNFHLQQLQRLANPTNFTKMGLWTLGGGVQSQTSASLSSVGGSNKSKSSSPRSSNSGGSKNPIAGMLQRELGISTLQGRKILEQRQKIQKVCSNLKECLKLLAKLNQLCEKKTQIFHNRMTKCQEVLTPKQVVKLLIWIDDNSQTLGSVCPGWGSEQFQSKSTATKKDSTGTT